MQRYRRVSRLVAGPVIRVRKYPAVKIFHPLLVEAVRDARELDERELASFAESIRDQICADAGEASSRPLFLWARRAIEGSRVR
jgi:hypothetical protein